MPCLPHMFLAAACIFTAPSALVQGATASKPLDLDDTHQRPQLVSQMEAIHAADDPLPANLTPIQRAMHSRDQIYNGMVQVALTVVINLNGRVDSAKPISGPERFYEQATAIEMHRAFKPIQAANGNITAATFTDYVSVYPPEEWLDHAPAFPEQVDLKTFRLQLQRTGCFGSCSQHSVTLYGSGAITYVGDSFVLIPGTHQAVIASDAVLQFVDAVRASRILSAKDRYEAGWTDNPSYTLTLDVNGLHKQVFDYIGLVVGMPLSIQELEDEVDRVTDSARWVKGDGGTMSALHEEHWNFATASADNLRLYNSALEKDQIDLIRAFNEARAPAISYLPRISSPLYVASLKGNGDAVDAMLARQPHPLRIPQRLRDRCFAASTRAGNVSLMRRWLALGAHVKPTPFSEEEDDPGTVVYPLLEAANSHDPGAVDLLLRAHAGVDVAANNNRSLLSFALGDPPDEDAAVESRQRFDAVVDLLLRAHASVSVETEHDRPVLFDVSEVPYLIPKLIAAGANVNQRDSDGNTPLMFASSEEAVKALLFAGADPGAKDKAGKSVIEMEAQWACKSCIALVQNQLRIDAGEPLKSQVPK